MSEDEVRLSTLIACEALPMSESRTAEGLSAAEAARRLAALPRRRRPAGSRPYADIVASNVFTLFNAILTALLDSISHIGKRTRGETIVRDDVHEDVMAQHSAIVDALERREPAAAAAAMLDHLRYVRSTLPDVDVDPA